MTIKTVMNVKTKTKLRKVKMSPKSNMKVKKTIKIYKGLNDTLNQNDSKTPNAIDIGEKAMQNRNESERRKETIKGEHNNQIRNNYDKVEKESPNSYKKGHLNK